MENKDLSLNEKVDLLLKNVPTEKEEESTKWKLPFFKRMKFNVSKKKIENGFAQFIIVRSTRSMEFTRAKVKDGIAIIDGFPRVATSDHVLLYNNKPTYIIPEWSLKPFSPEENYAITEKEKMNIAGRRAVLSVLETEKIKNKKDLGGLVWVIIVIAVVGGLYYFGKQSGWF